MNPYLTLAIASALAAEQNPKAEPSKPGPEPKPRPEPLTPEQINSQRAAMEAMHLAHRERERVAAEERAAEKRAADEVALAKLMATDPNHPRARAEAKRRRRAAARLATGQE